MSTHPRSRTSSRGRSERVPPSALFGAFVAAALAGCEKPSGDLPPPPPTSGRDVVVTATGKAAAPAPPTAASASARPVASNAPPRQLCTGQQPRPAPKGALSGLAAPGAAAPRELNFGVGKWIWINLWAAWCGPCKEEMPRLTAWQSKLSSAGVLIELAFVSLDDDERQLQRFLEAQPTAGGVRASYWLPEGGLRASWLAGLGVKESTELPVQALVAPSGQLTCVIQGAVEDRDYPAIASFVGAKNPK